MSYGAEIRVAVKLEQLKLLEDRITLLQGRFTKLNAAMANLGKFAQPKLNIDTLGAERKVAVLRKQIQSLNTGTTTVKVRTIFENSGSSTWLLLSLILISHSTVISKIKFCFFR